MAILLFYQGKEKAQKKGDNKMKKTVENFTKIFYKSEDEGYLKIEKEDIWKATKFFKVSKTILIKYPKFFLVREDKISKNQIRKYELKKIYFI